MRRISGGASLILMGIGRAKDVSDWLDKMKIQGYLINDDFSVSVSGDVCISEPIPSHVNFREVIGSFDMCYTGAKTLEGTPVSVGADFVCSGNNIQSLDHSPKKVGGEYIIYLNSKGDRPFTEDEIRSVCDVKGDVILSSAAYWARVE